jgi:hypothetical protein
MRRIGTFELRYENNIERGLREILETEGMDWSRIGPIVGFCEHCNKT